MADDWLGKELESVFDKIERRENKIQSRKTFDVLGKLPPWLLMNNRLQIKEARTHLSESTNTEIRKWIKSYQKALNSGNLEEGIEPDPNITWPLEFQPEIGTLSLYDNAIKAGKQDGLKLLLGEETAKAITGREGRQKGGRQGTEAGKLKAKEREGEILQILRSKSQARKKPYRFADQLISDVAKHFKDEFADGGKPPYGYGKLTIRRIYNRYLKHDPRQR